MGSAIRGFIFAGVVRQVAREDPVLGGGPGHSWGAGVPSMLCPIHSTAIMW